MIKLFLFTVLGAVLAGIAVFFAQEPGQVLINYHGYEITTSVPFLLASLFLTFFAIYLVFVTPFTVLRRRYRLKRLDSYNTLLYATVLSDLVCDDSKRLRRNLKKLWYSLRPGAKIASVVLDMMSARQYGQEQDFLKAAEKLVQEPLFSLHAYKELIDYYRSKGDDKKALVMAKDALKLNRKVGWLMQDLVELEIEEGSLENALRLLNDSYTSKFFDKGHLNKMKAVVYLMMAELPHKQSEREDLLIEANETDPSHTVIALKLAEFYRQINRPKKAMDVLHKAFRLSPALPLYRAYVDCMAGANDVDKLKSVEKLVVNASEDLRTFIMADIYMRISLWGQAWNEMNKYIQNHELTPALCKVMGRIEKFSGIQYHINECVAYNSEEREFDLWVCDKCGYISVSGYKAQCDNCKAIGSIVWKEAP